MKSLRSSCQQFANDLAVHVGKSEVSTCISVGQLFVIEAEQVEYHGMQVVNMDLAFDSGESRFVGLAVNIEGLTPPPAIHMVKP